MFLLSGVARYLFVPMAEAVVFAMLASYVLSRTLVPTMAKYLLRERDDAENARRRVSRNPFSDSRLLPSPASNRCARVIFVCLLSAWITRRHS